MKNLLKLADAKLLSKEELLTINGGKAVPQCDNQSDCPAGGCWYCIHNRCVDYCF